MKSLYFSAALAAVVVIAPLSHARERVTTGPVIRGVSSDKATTCDFSNEALNGDRLAGASVQCVPDNPTDSARQRESKRAKAISRLPEGFKSYCETTAKKLAQAGATLITAPLKGNPDHCDLSAIKPDKAQQIFGNASRR